MLPELGECPVAGVTIREALPSDEAFLRALYRSVREPELAITGWSEAQKAAFANQQYDLQDRAYRGYPEARFLVMERGGRAIGRLYVCVMPSEAPGKAGEFRLVDFALAPEARGAGLGTELMRWICERAALESIDVTLHVEVFNPARRFYARLGFREEPADGAYLKLRRESLRGG